MTTSPPLSTIHLAPLPSAPQSDIPLFPHRPRPRSMVSFTSSNGSSQPPPSSFNRRSRSLDLIKGLRIFAPSIAEEQDIQHSWEVIDKQEDDTSTSSDEVAPLPVRPPPTMDSTKKKGFFRRLSLSTSSHKGHVSTESFPPQQPLPVRPSPNASGSKSARRNDNVLAGPAYNSLPPGAAPSAFKHGTEPKTPPIHSTYPHSTPPRQRQPPTSPPSDPPTLIAKSPQRNNVRNPIHPALASPPNSPPRQASSTPYDVQGFGSTWRQSYSTPPGLNSIPNGQMGQINEHGVVRATPPQTPPSKRAIHTSPPVHSLNSMSSLSNALPDTRPMPKSMSNGSGRLSDAEIPPIPESHHRPSVASAGGRRSTGSTVKSPPTMRTPRVSTTSTRTPPTKISPTSEKRQPPLPHTTSSYFAPQVASKSAPHTPQPGVPLTDTSSGMSEASAYARAMSSNMRRAPLSPPERELNSASAPPAPEAPQRKSSRPLPRPPTERSPASQPSTVHVIASSTPPRRDEAAPKTPTANGNAVPNGHAQATPTHPGLKESTPEKRRPKLVITSTGSPPDKRVSAQPFGFDFPRSPTLPALVDPRVAPKKNQVQLEPTTAAPAPKAVEPPPATVWTPPSVPQPPAPVKAKNTPNGVNNVQPVNGARGSPVLSPEQIPVRASAAQPAGAMVISTSLPIASPVFASPVAMTPATRTPKATRKTTGRSKRITPATLAYTLAHPAIQVALLPYLTINSFLSLTGASDLVRKRLSGEMVGRWIMKEWGLTVPKERGRSWPNLTVWEGFLESLLHDPATYSTYGSQWHNLLQHLSVCHTLIILHLRNLPASVFPNSTLLPFEDEGGMMMPPIPFSHSATSLSSMNNSFARPRSRIASTYGSDAGSIAPSTRGASMGPPKNQPLVEIVMPEPLAAKPQEVPQDFEPPPKANKLARRSSKSSIVSFGRKRAHSVVGKEPVSPSTIAAPMPGKGSLPPVSFPAAKRYTFTRHGDPPPSSTRTRAQSLSSSRPGSILSVASSPSMSQRMSIGPVSNHRQSFAVDRSAPPVPGLQSMRSPTMMPSPINGPGGHRSSFASSDGRSNRLSDFGNWSPVLARNGSPFLRADGTTPPPRIEMAFDRPPPYVVGRAPILRVFVPLSDQVRRWPSAEGAAAAVRELDKCGATRRLKLGDLVANTALRSPKSTEHVLIFVPYSKYLLDPLDYRYSETGHLPSYIDAFALPPSFYYPFLSAPYIIFLNLGPYAAQAMKSLRLAFDRRDVTTTSGARLSAKRYLHVSGFEVKPGENTAPEWQGMVSLESEGTAEGKMELERRLGGGEAGKAVVGPWEIVREKSMMGTIWLRLVKEDPPS